MTDIPEPFETIMGADGCLSEVVRSARAVAQTNATTLIVGETGTGKELFARAIHAASSRRAQPFVAVSCGAIPETLFEAELFGHEKGAFSGADTARKGRIRHADGGTLLLDDVDALPLVAQAKLLRVIQEREVTPLGCAESHPVDVRIIATTNQNLEEEVQQRRFRADLFYRLCVYPLEIPPLRERKDGFGPLVEFLLRVESDRHQKPRRTLPPLLLQELKGRAWLGNVRELRNVVEQMVVFSVHEEYEMPSTQTVWNYADLPQPDDTPDHQGNSDCVSIAKDPIPIQAGVGLAPLVDDFKKALLKRALAQTDGNHRRAADLLGIHRSSFTRMLHRLNT